MSEQLHQSKEDSGKEIEKGNLASLAEDLDRLQIEKHEGKDRVMEQIIQVLKLGDAYGAKLLCVWAADKLSEYREDGIPMIIEKLYGGEGSPWFSVEKKMKKKK